MLGGAVSLREKTASDCIGRHYDRLNEDYRPMHGLCRLLLEHLGPDLASGNHAFPPFALNMPLLFQTFVAEWLTQNAPPGWAFTAQHPAKPKATYEIKGYKIDLLLQDHNTGRAIAVFDTKHKISDVPSASDREQIVAYAVEIGVNRAFLVYTCARSQRYISWHGGIKVESLNCDIALGAKAGCNLLEDLTSSLAIG